MVVAGRRESQQATAPVAIGGLRQLLAVLKSLTSRPRFREAPEKDASRRRARRPGIPMMCLVRGVEQEAILDRLTEYLAGAQPKRIPYAYYAFPRADPTQTAQAGEVRAVTEADVAGVAAVLLSVVHQLSSTGNAVHGRFRCPRFHLVYWLMKSTFSGDPERPDRVLRDLLFDKLRQRDLGRRKLDALPEAAADTAPPLPWWAQVVLRFGPALWFRIRLNAGVPVIGTEYRWLLRQPYLAPHDPGTVLGFAERIASTLAVAERPGNQREDPGQLLRLLVNAFLEDLRATYRRPPWRPRNARRTTYVVVLLDNISRQNGGYLLFKAINDVRNETGAFDPVVFVSGSHRVPPRALRPNEFAEPGEKAHQDPGTAYQAWQDNFRSSTRKREPAAWYMSIAVPETASEAEEAPDPNHHLEVPKSPLWSRKSVLAAVAVLLLGGAAWWAYSDVQAHCGTSLFNDNHSTLEVFDDGTLDGQCVGVSSEPIALTGSALAGQNNEGNVHQFTRVQEKIVEQNAEVARIHEQVPERPYLTLVYFSAFSAERYTLASEKERLMGVAARQREALDSGQEPLVRILLANGGNEMQAGERVAVFIRDLADDDPSIVGVIGLAQSREATAAAISAVGEAGLPMIAATLSADQLPGQSGIYFQVAPQNSREVEVIARFLRDADHGPVPSAVRVVQSADTRDIYSTNLGTVASTKLAEAGFTVEKETFSPSGTKNENMQEVGERLCRTAPDEAIFFAGRPVDFGTMLRAIGRCPQLTPPRIIASDDVSRYVADNELLQVTDVPFAYISFGVGTLGCTGTGGLASNLTKAFPEACAAGLNPTLDGHAALAYDTLSAFITASSPGKQPKAVHLVSRLYDIEFAGESGVIDFRNATVRGIPENKFLAVMSVDPARPGGGVRIAGYCGRPPETMSGASPTPASDLCAG
ncbi:ABC transporter substrate-binding protein [Saccharothrix sp. AJ9571]|nr:ABC transporter substrate-binding protein [Saccharothrix sp. AJ9571]